MDDRRWTSPGVDERGMVLAQIFYVVRCFLYGSLTFLPVTQHLPDAAPHLLDVDLRLPAVTLSPLDVYPRFLDDYLSLLDACMVLLDA